MQIYVILQLFTNFELYMLKNRGGLLFTRNCVNLKLPELLSKILDIIAHLQHIVHHTVHFRLKIRGEVLLTRIVSHKFQVAGTFVLDIISKRQN